MIPATPKPRRGHMAVTRIPIPEWARIQEADKRLELSLAEIDLSVRTVNCLEEQGIFTVENLLKRTRQRLLEVPNLGEKTLETIYDSFGKLGFHRTSKRPVDGPRHETLHCFASTEGWTMSNRWPRVAPMLAAMLAAAPLAVCLVAGILSSGTCIAGEAGPRPPVVLGSAAGSMLVTTPDGAVDMISVRTVDSASGSDSAALDRQRRHLVGTRCRGQAGRGGFRRAAAASDPRRRASVLLDGVAPDRRQAGHRLLHRHLELRIPPADKPSGPRPADLRGLRRVDQRDDATGRRTDRPAVRLLGRRPAVGPAHRIRTSPPPSIPTTRGERWRAVVGEADGALLRRLQRLELRGLRADDPPIGRRPRLDAHPHADRPALRVVLARRRRVVRAQAVAVLSSDSPAWLVRLPDRRIVLLWNNCENTSRINGKGRLHEPRRFARGRFGRRGEDVATATGRSAATRCATNRRPSGATAAPLIPTRSRPATARS